MWVAIGIGIVIFIVLALLLAFTWRLTGRGLLS